MKQDVIISPNVEQLYEQVQVVIEKSRAAAYRAANISMVQAYWNIGRLIVEEEQKGEQKAEYGKQIIDGLSFRLQRQYGRGFDKTNIWNMRKFHRIFPILDAVRQELGWTHYRLLMRVEKEPARQFYLDETIAGNWSTRTLERQINSLYYERMLMTSKEGRPAVKQGAESKKVTMQPQDIIKDPFVLDFLDLKPPHDFQEKTLEQALINKLQDFLLELGRGFSF